MDLDTTMTIDLDEIEEFITSEKFTNFLVSNTIDLATAAFILQVVMDKINECREAE